MLTFSATEKLTGSSNHFIHSHFATDRSRKDSKDNIEEKMGEDWLGKEFVSEPFKRLPSVFNVCNNKERCMPESTHVCLNIEWM